VDRPEVPAVREEEYQVNAVAEVTTLPVPSRVKSSAVGAEKTWWRSGRSERVVLENIFGRNEVVNVRLHAVCML